LLSVYAKYLPKNNAAGHHPLSIPLTVFCATTIIQWRDKSVDLPLLMKNRPGISIVFHPRSSFQQDDSIIVERRSPIGGDLRRGAQIFQGSNDIDGEGFNRRALLLRETAIIGICALLA
jgi:hypothetical protein